MTQQEREQERRRQAATLEQVIGMAWAMPRKNASLRLAFPPFRTLVKQ